MGSFEELSNTFADQGKTPLYFADSNHILGVIAVADVVKPTSAEAISQLKDMHIDVVMLTGDHKKTAQAIQKQLGIDRVVADVYKRQTLEKVELALKQGVPMELDENLMKKAEGALKQMHQIAQ